MTSAMWVWLVILVCVVGLIAMRRTAGLPAPSFGHVDLIELQELDDGTWWAWCSICEVSVVDVRQQVKSKALAERMCTRHLRWHGLA